MDMPFKKAKTHTLKKDIQFIGQHFNCLTLRALESPSFTENRVAQSVVFSVVFVGLLLGYWAVGRFSFGRLFFFNLRFLIVLLTVPM